MNEHDQHIIHSSEDPNWRTPPECFAALHREFDFTVDAAADKASTLCQYWMGPEGFEADALIAEWPVGAGAYFLNPPFSRKVAAQLKKAGDSTHENYRIENWAGHCWLESQRGCTIVALLPFAPQTEWYRKYVYGHTLAPSVKNGYWSGHAAREERRLPHRISYLTATGEKSGNAGVNTAVIAWKPNPGIVGPWQPHSFYWSYR